MMWDHQVNMDLRIFEKYPDVLPLLVRLHDSYGVYASDRYNNLTVKAELTDTVTALLAVDLGDRERELMTDVLTAMIRQAEKDLRTAISERLSALGTVPLRLALQFANDEIDVAAPILRDSPVLTDLDLVYIIKSQGPSYWQAIAGRTNLSPQLIDNLAETNDSGTALVLSQNERICLTQHAINILGEMAKTNEAIARPLLSRPEVPETLARRLYEHVGHELQAYLRTYYGTLDEITNKTVTDVVLEFSSSASEFMPSLHTINAADKFATLGMLNMQIIMDTLQRGQIATFIAFFAKYTGLPARRVHDFLLQACPKGMAIACRAFGIQKADFSRIYLMTNRMRARDRMVNQKDMLDVLSYFDKVKPDVAKRLVSSSEF